MCGHGLRKPIPHGHFIEAIVTLDERGQIVLPKEVREKAGLKPRDKLAVITHVHGDEVAYIMLIPARKLAESIRSFLGPLLKELLEESEKGQSGRGS